MKLTNILICCTLAVSTASCDSFLDVRPKAEKVEKDLFQDAQGFEDAIYGVYGALQQTQLYGRDLLWGIPEVLAQNMKGGELAIEALAKYDYTSNDELRQKLAEVWAKAYETIGWGNNVLNQLNNWSPESLPLYNYYKGEMLGVRAYLHFDLLRLFAPTNMGAQGIPYVTTYSYQVKPFYTVEKVYEFILEDLLEAERLLAVEEDGMEYPRTNAHYNKFLNYRETHFNLYAVRALLARVYWMKGDMANAARYACNVIDSRKFPLVDAIEVPDYLAGVLSPKETIFGAYSTGYVETAKTYLYEQNSWISYAPYWNSTSSGSNVPEPYDVVYAKDVPPTAQDYRLQHFKPGQGMIQYLKLVDYYAIEDEVPEARMDLITGVTLMHVSELHLIAAEALLATDYDAALRYFDAELKSRGLPTLAARGETLTADKIYNEYRKELFGEGQMWYNMKRLNKAILSNALNTTVPASDKVYVLPIPEDEFEYRDE